MGENSKTVRFGILGCAYIARKVARAIGLAPNATLCAIASRSKKKAEKFAAENGFAASVRVYGSYDQVLEDAGVDAVYIPLPTSLHVRWAVMAAGKKKHVLVEKPVALDVADLDRILEAVESNGVQFMDGTMWLHHPRTAHIQQHLFSVPHSTSRIGPIRFIHSTSTMAATPEFLESDIRVKAELDGLGALGDLAWYCIGASLWAKGYHLPTSVTALPDVTRNEAGVILSITASLLWDQPNQTLANIHCSFLSHTSMDLAICGSNGSLHLKDFIIPYHETSASFDLTFGAKFVDLHIGWNVRPEEVHVATELPQEALMVQEFARLVASIRDCGSRPSTKWPEISRKTQLVVDAVKKSLELGCIPVCL
ncbi:putative oxidoreductase, partial [Mucuna pruriens]